MYSIFLDLAPILFKCSTILEYGTEFEQFGRGLKARTLISAINHALE